MLGNVELDVVVVLIIDVELLIDTRQRKGLETWIIYK
jgi:hypothetical protein